MKENLILATAYTVLMDEGYRPTKEKPCPELTYLVFKVEGRKFAVLPNGDNYLQLLFVFDLPYNKEFSRLALYKLVNSYKCMQVDCIDYTNEKTCLSCSISFNSMILNTSDMNRIIESGIKTILQIIEQLKTII